MIEIPTVFILGAGASKAFGFPLAEELRKSIIKNSRNIYTDKNGHNLSQELCRKFSDSSIRSIDYFLRNHKEYLEVGMVAICHQIIKYEIASAFREHNPNFKEDWFFQLYNIMMKGVTGDHGYRQFSNNQVSFITFNYDRSLEKYFFESLRNSFGAIENDEQVVKVLNTFPIWHVYGSLGKLPWQDTQKNVPYGRSRSDFELRDISTNIQIVDPEYYSSEINDTLKKAKRVFFLGFGYDELNMERIKFFKSINPSKIEIYGTVYRFSPQKINKLKEYFKTSLEKRIMEREGTKKSFYNSNQLHFVDCGSAQLLNDYLEEYH